MKKIGYVILFALICNAVYSQNTSFGNLQTPASPGFILLDQTPSAIERPTTPQGFGLSLLSLVNSGSGAVEFAPFWLARHPKVTAEKISNSACPVLYNLSLSLGTVTTDTGKYVTAGLRTRVFQKYNADLKKRLANIKQQMVDLLSVPNPTANGPKLDTLAKQYNAIVSKPVINVEFAAAIAGTAKSLANNKFDMSRAAAWVAFNCRPKGDDFYFTVLGRYIYNVQFADYSKNAQLADFGTRLNYDFNSFFLSAEYLQRLNFTDKDYSAYRLAIVAGYEISKNLYLTGTFGKNFANVKNLITMVGINFGISNDKIKANDVN